MLSGNETENTLAREGTSKEVEDRLTTLKEGNLSSRQGKWLQQLVS